jgi:PAS domain S-box-containing protein
VRLASGGAARTLSGDLDLRSESAGWLRAIFDNVRVGVRLADVASGGVILQANRAFHELLGYPDGELIGKTIFEITHPEDLPENRRLWQQVIDGESNDFQLEKRYLRRDGTVVWGRLTVSPVRDPQGRALYMVGLVEDITSQKQAEELVRRQSTQIAESTATARAMLDAALDAIITIDQRGAIESINPAGERMFGYEAVELLGKNVKMLMPEPYRREHDGYMAAYRETGERKIIGIGREVVAQRKDGSTFPIELAVSEVWQGERRFFMGTLKDLTMRKQLEEQLLHAQKMEAVGRLAGGIAHDFNNLLASIIGYSEMLLDRLGDGPLAHAAHQVRRSAERGAALTRQLLAFSRRQELHSEPIDLNAVLLEMQDMMERLLGERVSLSFALGEELWPALGDRGQLQQVVLNLMVNARDALGDGGAITVSTANVELHEERRSHGGAVGAGEWVWLAVSDTGCGMSEAVVRRIFEPFFTTKEPGKGTGLGLSTVYGIVRQSGGGILVETAPGAGTTFEVFLPRVTARPARPRVEAIVEPVGGAETVLLVEDDGMFRELLAEVLHDAGYRVLVAREPQAALALVAEADGAIDLLLSDLVMPGMRGSELARRLRERQTGLRVVLMSGYSEVEEGATAAQELGADFLQKPFSTKELLRTVRRQLDGSR